MLRALLLLPLLGSFAAAGGPGSLILTGPPPPDSTVDSVTACHAIVTVNANGVPVTGQPVCATAETRIDFSCLPQGPDHVRCTMTWTLTGGGHSPLLLPGTFAWDLGVVEIFRCIPGPGGRPDCVSILALYPDTGAWPGLVLGASGASTSQSISRDILMPLNVIIPPCFQLAGLAELRVRAEVALGPLSVAQAEATAASYMDKMYCD